MVWVVARVVKTRRGERHYNKQKFASWQSARVYQQDLWWRYGNQVQMWEE